MTSDTPENVRVELGGVYLTSDEAAYLAGYLADRVNYYRKNESLDIHPLLQSATDKLRHHVFGDGE